MIAGTDTTAGAIRSTLMYIMATPRVYSRLKSMIKQCVERNEVSSPISYGEAQKLPYLQVCSSYPAHLECLSDPCGLMK